MIEGYEKIQKVGLKLLRNSDQIIPGVCFFERGKYYYYSDFEKFMEVCRYYQSTCDFVLLNLKFFEKLFDKQMAGTINQETLKDLIYEE